MSLQTLPLDLLEKILSFCSSNDAARMLRMNQHLKAVISEILSSSYWTAKTIVERKFSIQSSAEVDQKSPFISEIARMFQAIVNGGSKDPRREVKDWFDKAYPVSITLKLNCTCLDAFHQRYDDDQDDDFVRCLGVYDRRSSLINSYPSYEQRETNVFALVAPAVKQPTSFSNSHRDTIEVNSRCIYQFKGEWSYGRRWFKQTGGTNVLWVATHGEWHLTTGDFRYLYAISAHEAPSLCPADPRAGRFEAWPELVVNCDVHHDLSPIHLRN